MGSSRSRYCIKMASFGSLKFVVFEIYLCSNPFSKVWTCWVSLEVSEAENVYLAVTPCMGSGCS